MTAEQWIEERKKIPEDVDQDQAWDLSEDCEKFTHAELWKILEHGIGKERATLMMKWVLSYDNSKTLEDIPKKTLVARIAACAWHGRIHADQTKKERNPEDKEMTEEKKKIIEGFLADHVKWLQDSKTGKRLEVHDDLLKGCDLSGRDLRWAYFSDADLEGCDLRWSNFSGVNLERANLRLAHLERANFSWANLKFANLKGLYLRLANFENADLSGCDLRFSNFSGANLERANLDRANLGRSNLRRANLEVSSLVDTNLYRANLERANLRIANLERADVRWADFSGANLKGTILEGTIIK